MSNLCTYWLTYHSSYIICRNLARPPWGREGILFPSILYDKLGINDHLIAFLFFGHQIWRLSQVHNGEINKLGVGPTRWSIKSNEILAENKTK